MPEGWRYCFAYEEALLCSGGPRGALGFTTHSSYNWRMHPHTFYSTLFDYEKRDEVFVIMSFSPVFDERWLNVIRPCMREDVGLEPKRVDYSESGESVIHDILTGIAHARLVLADITSTPMRDMHGKLWPQRNGNVMWELGIAHVMRVPDEVIVVKSDNDESIFDLTQFRAFYYNPADVIGARRELMRLAKDRLKAVELAASDHVKRCASSLDLHSWFILLTAAGPGIQPPISKTMGDVMGNMARLPAIARLLEMGALRTAFTSLTPELFHKQTADAVHDIMRYQITPFGAAILRYCAEKMGVFSPEIRQLAQQMSQQLGIVPGQTA